MHLDLPQQLPISQYAEQIKQLLATNKVIIVAGDTGSGKSTQLPKICLQAGLANKGLIGHTQPRRLAASSIAERLAVETQTDLGGLVGYKMRFAHKLGPNTKIKLMTDGILLTELQSDKWLNKYQTIIIDEAHERSLNIDFLLGVLKRLLAKRDDLKVVITSATLDYERFSQHFHNAPIVTVSGRTYPVAIRYQPPVGDNNDDSATSDNIIAAVKELFSEGPGDILVFLPTEREIRDCKQALEQQTFFATEILPLYARLPSSIQRKVFSPSSKRKIVLATNVAETSLTVPGIRYVIDTGTARISRYSHRSKMQRLPIEPIAQAAADQRAGRCGRVAAGICIRLYSQEDYDNRPRHTTPELLRTNLAAVILQMFYLKLGQVHNFPFVDKPDNKLITDGYKLLASLQALQSSGKKLTALGRQLARLPIEPRLARMLVAAHAGKCLDEVLVIVSALAVSDPRERPEGQEGKAANCHRRYYHPDSDFLSLLILWQDYHQQTAKLSHNKTRQYCQKHFLSYKRLREWRQVHRQLLQMCEQMHWQPGQLDPEQGVASWLTAKHQLRQPKYQNIHKALLTGCLDYIARREDKGFYTACRGLKCHIFPGSNLAAKKPKWLMAAAMVETSKVFARTVAVIEPNWLEAIASHLVKTSYSEPFWDRKAAMAVAHAKVSLFGLDIIPKRRVYYGNIDQEISRQLFARHALVEGEWDFVPECVACNNELIDQVKQVEDKTRRRGLVLADDKLADWYLQRLPQWVITGSHFQKWWRQLAPAERSALFITENELLAQDGELAGDQYPQWLQFESLKLPLSYNFEPGSDTDGVTVTVPLPALAQLTSARISYLVPALWLEKITALIRGLPKTIRKNYVPAPQYAQACLESIQEPNQDISLEQQVADKLTAMTGVQLDAITLQQVDLPWHLQMRLQVINADGEVLAADRNLDKLRQQLDGQLEQAQQQLTASSEEDRPKGQSWVFGELPTTNQQTHQGVMVTSYPALTPTNQAVTVDNLATAEEARYQHYLGLRQLLSYHFRGNWHNLKANKVFIQCAQSYQRFIASEKVYWTDLWLAVLDRAILQHTDSFNIRSGDQFQQLLDSNWQWQQVSSQLGRELELITKHLVELGRKLKQKNINPQLLVTYQDLKSQLEHLCCPMFISSAPLNAWPYYPIYLRGMLRRLERAQNKPHQDRVNQQMVEPYWQACLHNWQHTQQPGPWQDFRWLVESWRLAVFVPELKAMPVSAQELARTFHDVTRLSSCNPHHVCVIGKNCVVT